MGNASDDDWVLAKSPSPDAIWSRLSDKSITSLTFSGPPLWNSLRDAIDRGEASYLRFVDVYKHSVEFAWISACALLGDTYWREQTFPTVYRKGNGLKVVLNSYAITAIRERKELDVRRAAVLPEVLGGIILNFYRAHRAQDKDLEFQLGLGDQDTHSLTSTHNRPTVVSLVCAQFVRSESLSPPDDDVLRLGRIETYGFDHSTVRHKIEYKPVPTEPEYMGSEKVCIPTYLCFPTFTSYDGSGLNLALKAGTPSAAASSSESFPASAYWYNHHQCGTSNDDNGKNCPEHHFDSDREAALWRDYSVRPYVAEWDKQMRDNSVLDYLVLLSTGIKFQSHLLGLFLTLSIAYSEAARNSGEKIIATYMRDCRSHIGHYRYLMMENLATEMWHESIKFSRELERASMSFARHHGQLQHFLDAALAVRNLVDPLAMEVSSLARSKQLVGHIFEYDNGIFHDHPDTHTLEEGKLEVLDRLLNSGFEAIHRVTEKMSDQGKALVQLVLREIGDCKSVADRWCLAHACYKETISLGLLTGEEDKLSYALCALAATPASEGGQSALLLAYACATLAEWKTRKYEFALREANCGFARLVIGPATKEFPHGIVHAWQMGLKEQIWAWIDGTRNRLDDGGFTSKEWARVLRGIAGDLSTDDFREWFKGVGAGTEGITIPIVYTDERSRHQ